MGPCCRVAASGQRGNRFTPRRAGTRTVIVEPEGHSDTHAQRRRGPVVRVQVVLLPEPQSASSARDFLRRCLRETYLGRETYLDTALLVVTELVTNAVRHGQSTVTLAVTVDDGRLLLEVADEGSGVPNVRHPGWQAVGGRGLLLVEALATRWGVQRLHGGKVVWAELPAPSRHMLEPSGGVPSGRAGAEPPEAPAGQLAPSV